jgi:2'-5' RNA ligase
MKRRLFIAINLEAPMRKAIENIEKNIESAFAWEQAERIRFTPEENWHITVSFLGTQDDANLMEIMAAIRKAAEEFSAVDISFTEVAYVPERDNARMIWLKTSRETSHALGNLRNTLENLLDQEGVRFGHESRGFSGHLTLARFSEAMSASDLPPIERTIKVICAGTSLDLMKSELERRGASYTTLQKFPFSEK